MSQSHIESANTEVIEQNLREKVVKLEERVYELEQIKRRFHEYKIDFKDFKRRLLNKVKEL